MAQRGVYLFQAGVSSLLVPAKERGALAISGLPPDVGPDDITVSFEGGPAPEAIVRDKGRATHGMRDRHRLGGVFWRPEAEARGQATTKGGTGSSAPSTSDIVLMRCHERPAHSVARPDLSN